jgi:hypothetical protein
MQTKIGVGLLKKAVPADENEADMHIKANEKLLEK